jgi:hypothetical protein
MLDAASIVAEAETRAGIADSEPTLRGNLDRLVASLNSEARLPPLGEASARKSLVDRTADRLEGLKWLHDRPQIGNEVIAQPVFLTISCSVTSIASWVSATHPTAIE